MISCGARLAVFDIAELREVTSYDELELDTLGDMGFDALIPALNSGNIDVAIAGMSITDERKKVVVFSDPYKQMEVNNEKRSF